MVDCDADGTVHPRAGYISPLFGGGIWLRKDYTEQTIDSYETDIAYLTQYKIRCQLMLTHIAWLKKRCTELEKRCTDAGIELPKEDAKQEDNL